MRAWRLSIQGALFCLALSSCTPPKGSDPATTAPRGGPIGPGAEAQKQSPNGPSKESDSAAGATPTTPSTTEKGENPGARPPSNGAQPTSTPSKQKMAILQAGLYYPSIYVDDFEFCAQSVNRDFMWGGAESGPRIYQQGMNCGGMAFFCTDAETCRADGSYAYEEARALSPMSYEITNRRSGLKMIYTKAPSRPSWKSAQISCANGLKGRFTNDPGVQGVIEFSGFSPSSTAATLKIEDDADQSGSLYMEVGDHKLGEGDNTKSGVFYEDNQIYQIWTESRHTLFLKGDKYGSNSQGDCQIILKR